MFPQLGPLWKDPPCVFGPAPWIRLHQGNRWVCTATNVSSLEPDIGCWQIRKRGREDFTAFHTVSLSQQKQRQRSRIFQGNVQYLRFQMSRTCLYFRLQLVASDSYSSPAGSIRGENPVHVGVFEEKAGLSASMVCSNILCENDENWIGEWWWTTGLTGLTGVPRVASHLHYYLLTPFRGMNVHVATSGSYLDVTTPGPAA